MSVKHITSGTEDQFYGVERRWLVKKLSTKEFFSGTERQDRKVVIDLDFGRPKDLDSRHNEYLGYRSWDIINLIENTTKEVMESGTRKDIVSEVLNKLWNDYELQITYTSYSKASAWQNHLNIELRKKDEGDFKELGVATEEDIKSYLSENERNQTGEIDTYSYHTSQNSYYGENAVKYFVEKMLKEKYTYCVKMGKNIVPDKYIADGSAGIERWRNEKSSSNKNNSIEKQMIKKIRNQKKQCAYEKFYEVMNKITENHDWSIVFLSIDGHWNKARTIKTINKFILNGGDDELLTITDEEIEKRCKSYWVYTLEQVVEKVKKMEFRERTNQ